MSVLVLVASRINNDFVAGLGLFLNLIYLLLILTSKQHYMKRMSRVLLQNCVLDLVFAVVLFFSGYQIVLQRTRYYVVIGSTFFHNAGFNAACWLTMLFNWSFLLDVFALPVPFFTRYLLICRRKEPTNRVLLAAYTIVFGVSVVPVVMSLWSYPRDPGYYEQFAEPLNTSEWRQAYGHRPYFVAVELTNPAGILFDVFTQIGVAVSYAFVLFFVLRIRRTQSKNAELTHSSRIKRTQTQVFRVLVFHAFSPVFTGIVPTAAVMMLFLLRVDSISAPLLCTGLMKWFVVVNPVAAFIIIQPYRRRLCAFVRLISMSSVSESASSIAHKTPSTLNLGASDEGLSEQHFPLHR